LVTYRSWVRHTWIGATLNGKRFPVKDAERLPGKATA
jgi:hypothetical protein